MTREEFMSPEQFLHLKIGDVVRMDTCTVNASFQSYWVVVPTSPHEEAIFHFYRCFQMVAGDDYSYHIGQIREVSSNSAFASELTPYDC